MLRSSVLSRLGSARSAGRAIARSAVLSYSSFAGGVGFRRAGNGARKLVLGLGSLAISGVGARQFCEAKAEMTEKRFKMVKRADKEGLLVESDLSDVVQSCGEADVILIGECHDDQTAHNFEEEFLKQCFAKHKARGLVLSLEMFETDVQGVVNEYLAGAIREKDFVSDSRAWNNYVTDYRPLVEFARANAIPVVAANAPRRYVSRVGSAGRAALEQLPLPARQHLAPLPYATPSAAYAGKFKAQMEALHSVAQTSNSPSPSSSSPPSSSPSPSSSDRSPTASGASSQRTVPAAQANARGDKGRDGGEGSSPGKECPYIGFSAQRTEHMLDAQVLWDATMAHSIAQASEEDASGRRPLVVHVCGKFHCENRLGIPEHLQRYDDSLRSVVVVCAGWEELSTMEEQQVAQLGDFVVVSPPNAPKSFEIQHV